MNLNDDAVIAPTLDLRIGDCLESLRAMPDNSVHCVVTSPPYFGLRDYGVDGQIGLEPTPDEFVAALVAVMREVRRVLRDDGTLWLNIGDSYASGGRTTRDTDDKLPRRGMGVRPADGAKPKDLLGIPWRVAFALQADGWYLRQDIIWHKPNPMPESVRDRCTKSHEYIFMLTKSARYYFDNDAIAEPLASSSLERLSQPTLQDQVGSARVPGKTNGNMKAVARSGNLARKSAAARGVPGADPNSTNGAVAGSIPWEGSSRNKRSVWTVTTKPFKGAHFATFPPDLIEPCILAGSPPGGVVLDPFGGSGTTAGVAIAHGRAAVLCELNPEYAALVQSRVDAILKWHRRRQPANDNEPALPL